MSEVTIVPIQKSMTEPEYRALPYLSYSMLAGVDKNPSNILNTEFKQTKSLLYGSVVDCLLFDGEEEFRKKYAIMDYDGPTDIVKEVVDQVYEKYIESKDSFLFNKNAKLKDLYDLVLQTARQLDYGGKNWKDDTIVSKIVNEGGSDYFDFLKLNIDKTMIDAWMYERAINSVYTLQNNDISKSYLTQKEGIEIQYQFPIIWNYDGEKCKSLLDILFIDHNTKTIIPVDLKTTYDDVLEFPKNYLKWKYYIQAAFYTKAVHYLKLQYKHLFDYKVESFRFMVISSNDTKRPLIWLTNEKDLVAGELGGVLKDGTKVRGFKDLINDYKWHKEHDLYSYPREVYDKIGHLELDVF